MTQFLSELRDLPVSVGNLKRLMDLLWGLIEVFFYKYECANKELDDTADGII